MSPCAWRSRRNSVGLRDFLLVDLMQPVELFLLRLLGPVRVATGRMVRYRPPAV
jgi:hypothetical protein